MLNTKKKIYMKTERDRDSQSFIGLSRRLDASRIITRTKKGNK